MVRKLNSRSVLPKLNAIRSAASYLLCSTALFSTGAMAQTASKADQAPPDIVVTATKRSATLKDTPLAVSALSGAALQQANVTSIANLTYIDPAVQIQNKGAGDTQIIIRGIQSAGASLVSVYMDEAVITGSDFNGDGGRQSPLAFYDIDRVEILKGPQGTLFGSGSMAGSVRIIANKPTNDYSFKLSASGEGGSGSNARYETYGVANIPIVEDKLALRVTAWDVDGGGYLDRKSDSSPRTASNTNDEHAKGARAILAWHVTPDFTITATGIAQSLKVDDADNYTKSKGAYVIGTPTLGSWDEHNYLGSLVGEYRFPIGTITATSSYYKQKLFDRGDTTPTAKLFGLTDGYQINEGQDRSVWSSELRFASTLEGPLQFVGGLFYERDRDLEQNVIGRASANGNLACKLYADCVDVGLASDLLFARALKHDNDQIAVFGQADYNITRKLTLTVGIRRYRAKIDWDETSYQKLRTSLLAAVQTAPINTLNDSEKQHNTSYNFSIGWRPTPQASFYARAASGFRLGGINSLSSRELDSSVPVGYKSDSLWNYEVGGKFSFFDRRLTINTALYYIDWSGQQVSQITASGVTSYIANAGKSNVKGIEFQFSARPVRGLTLGGGVTYTDSRLTEDQPTASTDAAAGRDGDRIPYVPKWSWSGQAEYETSVGSGVAYADTTFNYRGKSYTDFNQNGTYIPVMQYFRADASVGYRWHGWDASVFVKNLTNKVAEVGVVALTGGDVAAGDATITTIPPRTVGLKLEVSF